MTPYYSDDWLSIYQGDVREVLPTLPADSVDCIVTSPPYWGLRDYGTAAWVGGDDVCDHMGAPLISDKSTLAGFTSENIKLRTNGSPYKGTCGKCGAVRQDGQLGLERTPEEYVANMVRVFAEVRRVLKPSGTCWLNLGDSYAGGGQTGRNDHGIAGSSRLGPDRSGIPGGTPIPRTKVERFDGLKPKDLVGIPWRVAFALQADGWYLRSDIIWAKPNPMPESVTDRPTKAHEYLFLLTKASKYYFDADAVREPSTFLGPNGAQKSPYAQGFGRRTPDEEQARREKIRGHARIHEGFADRWDGMSKAEQSANGRNIRSVWNIATRPYPGAHFAVFPPELPERCIKAGSPELGTVLDPFAGSGTTGMVANRLSRRAILIDLNADYLKQQLKRNAQTPLGLGAA